MDRALRRSLLAWSLTALGACGFHGSYDGTQYQCGVGDTCPAGLSCIDGLCTTPGTVDAATADAPLGVDAASLVDASADAAPPLARCGTVALLVDPFDATTPYWNAFTDGVPTTAISGGRLTIAIPTSAANQTAALASRYAYDFAEASVVAEVSQVGGHSTALDVLVASGDAASLRVTDGQLTAVLNIGGNNAMQAQVPYVAATHRYWRLREQAGTTYWEWSPNGAAWTELAHHVDAFALGDVRVRISARGALAAASEAHVEGVNVGTAPGSGPCPAAALVDPFTSTLGPAWGTFGQPGSAVTVTGGAAVITTDGQASEYGGFLTSHLYDLRASSFYVDATTVPQVTPAAFVTWAQAMGAAQGNTMLQFDVNGTTLTLTSFLAGTAVNSQTFTYDPTAHRYWRFRASADGHTIFFDTSPDAATWTQRLSVAATFDPREAVFVMGGGEFSATAPRTIRFGGVNTP